MLFSGEDTFLSQRQCDVHDKYLPATASEVFPENNTNLLGSIKCNDNYEDGDDDDSDGDCYVLVIYLTGPGVA